MSAVSADANIEDVELRLR